MTEIIDKIFVFGFWTFAVFFMLAIVSLPTVLAYLVNRWLTKKGVKYIGIVLLIIAPVWTAYEAYTAVYPTDNFYFSEFKKVTLQEIPKSAKILNKYASYPDFHGDYCSVSLMTVTTDDYLALLNELTNDKRIIKNEQGEIIGSSELYRVMGNLKADQIIHSFTRNIAGQKDRYLYIGFFNDKKTIIVYVSVI